MEEYIYDLRQSYIHLCDHKTDLSIASMVKKSFLSRIHGPHLDSFERITINGLRLYQHMIASRGLRKGYDK